MSLSHIVFLSKQLFIIICVLSGFVWIRQMSEGNLRMAFIAMANHVMYNLGFLAMYNYAYRIPQYMTMVQDEVRLLSQMLLDEDGRSEFGMRMAAIPKNLGMKSGSFHTIERESTLIFVDYVYGQVINLLLTY